MKRIPAITISAITMATMVAASAALAQTKSESWCKSWCNSEHGCRRRRTDLQRTKQQERCDSIPGRRPNLYDPGRDDRRKSDPGCQLRHRANLQRTKFAEIDGRKRREKQIVQLGERDCSDSSGGDCS